MPASNPQIPTPAALAAHLDETARLVMLRRSVQEFLFAFDNFMKGRDLYPDQLAEQRNYLERTMEATSGN